MFISCSKTSKARAEQRWREARESDECMGRRKAAHCRKDSNYRNAVVALFAPAGGSQDRVVRNVGQPVVLELYTDAPAQSRVRDIGLPGHALGKKLVDRTARTFKRRLASMCCARPRRPFGWPRLGSWRCTIS